MRPARPRPRLRVERDDRDIGQRRHLRRGPLPGRLPLPLQGPVPCRWRSSSARTPGRRTPATTTPAGSETLTAYRTVHGIVYARGTVGGKKVAFVSGAHDLLPRGRLARSASTASTTRASCTSPQSFRQARRRHQLRLQLGLRRLQAHRLPAVGLVPAARAGHVARLPGPRHRRVRLAGLRPRAAHDEACSRSTSARNAIDQPYLVSWNGKQAPGWAAADDEYSYGPAPAPADDRRRSSRAALRGGQQDGAAPARPGDGGAGDAGHPRARSLPTLRKVLGKSPIPKLRDAVALLTRWRTAGRATAATSTRTAATTTTTRSR